jgi:hypothetical protein
MLAEQLGRSSLCSGGPNQVRSSARVPAHSVPRTGRVRAEGTLAQTVEVQLTLRWRVFNRDLPPDPESTNALQGRSQLRLCTVQCCRHATPLSCVNAAGCAFCEAATHRTQTFGSVQLCLGAAVEASCRESIQSTSFGRASLFQACSRFRHFVPALLGMHLVAGPQRCGRRRWWRWKGAAGRWSARAPDVSRIRSKSTEAWRLAMSG